MIYLSNKEMITRLVADYTKAIETTKKAESFASAYASLDRNYMERGICWYTSLHYHVPYIGKEDWVTKYLPEHERYWYTQPNQCSTKGELIDCLEYRLAILQEELLNY